MHPRALSLPPLLAAETPIKQQHTSWATATERQGQMQDMPAATCQSSSPATHDALSWSDFQPAEELLAALPENTNASTSAFQRPRRPKVQVSDSLQSLLDSTTAVQSRGSTPGNATWQTASKAQQPAAKAVVSSSTPLNKIMFGRRAQPMAVQPEKAIQVAEQTVAGQATAALPALQAAKRPATASAPAIVPTFAKRPKLAASSKPPAASGKAALSKAAATGTKQTALKKATAKKPAASKAVLSATHLATPAAVLAPSVSPAATTAPANAPVTAVLAAAAVVSNQKAVVPHLPAVGLPEASAAAPPAPAKAPRQRKKADDIDLAVVEKKVIEKHATGSLTDLSVPEIKCFLKARKVPVGGKKADLISRLEPLLSKP